MVRLQVSIKLTSIETAIINAISKAVQTMLYPPIKNLGVKGMSRFADELVRWPKRFPPENALFRQLLSQLRHDGGRRHRRWALQIPYSRFLKEAGGLLGNKELANLGQRYDQIGQKWATIARLIRETYTRQAKPSEKSRGKKQESCLRLPKSSSNLLSILHSVNKLEP